MRICCTFVVSLLLLISSAYAQEKLPHYLSFEEKTVISYVLLAYEKPTEEQKEIYQRLLSYTKQLITNPIEVVEVQNFDEFVEKYRGDWPRTHSLEKNIELIEAQGPHRYKQYVSKNPRIQWRINQFLAYQRYQSGALFLSGLPFKAKNFFSIIAEAPQAALSMSQSTNIADILELKQLAIEKLNSVIRGTLANIETTGLNQLANLKIEDRRSQITVETFFTEYFARMSLDTKKVIISDLLHEDIQAPPAKKIEVMILNSGPQFQKILQIIAHEKSLPEDLALLFKRLESSTKAVPAPLVQEIIDAERGNYDFVTIEQKPLGTGTMAQVHRAKVAVGGKIRSVVLRFLKPGIEKKVAEDYEVLKALATILDNNPEMQKLGAPKLGPLVDDITKTIRDELSMADTVERQIQGKKNYTKEKLISVDGYKLALGFHVPEIILPKTPDTHLMIQEMVFGQKLSKEYELWKTTMPSLKKVLAEQVAELWIEELIFKSGFYHSDLHQGNFLVKVAEPTTTISLLDFGMGGRISKTQQESLILLGLSIELKNPAMLAAMLWQISEEKKNSITKETLSELTSAKVHELNKQGREMSTDEWMVWATEAGLKLSFDMISINRGFVIISKLLESNNSDETLMSITKKISLRYPHVIYALSQKMQLGLKDYYELFHKALEKEKPKFLSCQALFN